MIALLKKLTLRGLERADAEPTQEPAPAPEPMRFCADCRFHAVHPDYPYAVNLDLCNAPPNLTVHLVSGRVVHRLPACIGLRSHDLPQFCGPKALWFEPIESHNPPAAAGKPQED